MSAASSGFTDAQIVDYITQRKHHLPATLKQHQHYLTTLSSFGDTDSIKEKIKAYEHDYQTNELIISTSKQIIADAEFKDNLHIIAAGVVTTAGFLGSAAMMDAHFIPEVTGIVSVIVGFATGSLVKKGLDTSLHAYTKKELQQIKDKADALEQQQKFQTSVRSALQALHDNNPVFLENNNEAVFYAEEIVLSEIRQRRPSILAS